MTNLEVCEIALASMKEKVVSDQSGKGIRSSGASADSLKVKMASDGGDLLGNDYFYQQIYGRKPGKFPPLKSIEEWIESKNIPLVDITKKGLAFLIARKIAKMGTNIFIGKSPALALSDIVQVESTKAAEGVGKNTVEEILSMFRSLNTKR